MTDLPKVVKVTTPNEYIPPIVKINNQVFKVKE